MWEEVAEAVEEAGTVTVAHVDVTANGALGKRFGIKGFPTLLLFSKGQVVKFPAGDVDYPRDAEGLAKFATVTYLRALRRRPRPGHPTRAPRESRAGLRLASPRNK